MSRDKKNVTWEWDGVRKVLKKSHVLLEWPLSESLEIEIKRLFCQYFKAQNRNRNRFKKGIKSCLILSLVNVISRLM